MKKYISFTIMALMITFVVSFTFPAFKVKAETGNSTISLHQSTKIYRDNEAPFSQAEKVSEYVIKTPSITVLTHGYNGSPAHFSNISGPFAPTSASVINEIIEKTEVNGGVNIYYVKYEKDESTTNVTRTIFKLSYTNYGRLTTHVVNIIDDVSKHIVLIYEASVPDAGHKATYDEFDNLLDTISLQYKALTGYLPIYNLIGHSRGGIINLMYATEHPYNVDKVISMGTPYRGSRLGMIDQILVFSQMLETVNTPKPQGMLDILSEVDPENPADAAITTSATEVRNNWNAVYSQGVRASIISIGTMTDLSYINELLTDPTVSSYVDESTAKVLQKVINCANQVPGLANSIVNFVDGIASIAQAFGLNTIADMGFEENTWTNVEIEIYRKILQLVKVVNGELVIADDLFIDTDSQLGMGFEDGISYSGFQRHIKILTDDDMTENKSSYSDPPIGHNVETMNADIVSFIGNSLTFGYAVNNVETITDDEEKTISYNPPDTNLSYDETVEWIDYQLLKYTTNYNGNREFILTNAQAEVYKYNTAGYLTKDVTANISNYTVEAGKTYYIKVKPLNSSAKIKIVPTETVISSTTSSYTLSYNGNKAIQLKATTAGYYSIQIPSAINVTCNKELFKHQIPSSNYCYVRYFSAQENISLYLFGGTMSTVEISFLPVTDLESNLSDDGKLESSNDIRAFSFTNDSNSTKEYTVFAFYNENVQASSFSAFSANGAIATTNTLCTNFNMYKFSILANQTVCLVFGQNGTEFSIGENNETYEWLINNSPVVESEIYLRQENVTVSLNKYVNGVLVETNCSITESHNLFVGNTLNLDNCIVGTEISLYYTYNASEVLKIYILPTVEEFYAVNNDEGVRIYPKLRDKNNINVPKNRIRMNVLVNGVSYEIGSDGLLVVNDDEITTISNISIQGVSYKILLNTPTMTKFSEPQPFSFSLSVNTHFDGGAGSSVFPYKISCKRHLKNIKYSPYSSYSLQNDIDLNNSIWEPLPTFYGTFEGNNKTIKNIRFSSTNAFTGNLTYIGFFQKNYGIIKNIQFTNVQVDLELNNTVYFGVVSGLCYNNAKILNCDVSSINTTMLIETGSYTLTAGVITGYNQGGCIEQCSASFSLFKTDSDGYCNVGGIVGSNTAGDVVRCYSDGRIEVYSTGDGVNLDVGGLIGRCTYSSTYGDFGYVQNCYSTSYVYAEATGSNSYVYVGGLIGVLKESRVSYCYATGEVWGKNYTGNVIAGGFAGLIENCTNQGYVHNCFTFGDVYARGNYSGAERRYSFFGRLCGDEANNGFLNIYYNLNSGFKEGLTGTEVTWTASWYIGKTEEQLKTVSFQTSELGLSSTYWNFVEGEFPTLK